MEVSEEAAAGAKGSAKEKEQDKDYMGCKFLTSSQLFRLQLHDPQLRQQILAQVGGLAG